MVRVVALREGERPREELARDDREQGRQQGQRRLRRREPERGALELVARRPRSPRSGARPRGPGRPPRAPPGGSRPARRSPRPGRARRARRPARGRIGGRHRLRGDPAGLEQLERDLAGGRELDAAADHEHPPDEGERQPARATAPRARGASLRSGRPPARRRRRTPCRGPRRARPAARARPPVFMYVFVAAIERSGPAASGRTASAARPSSESGSFVTATV